MPVRTGREFVPRPAKTPGQLALDRTWSIAPQQDVPWEGRARDDLSGFSLPAWQMSEADDTLTIATRQLRVTVHQPLWLEWSYRDEAGRMAAACQ